MSAATERLWTARYVHDGIDQWYASLDGEVWYPLSRQLHAEDVTWFRSEITPLTVDLGEGKRLTTVKISYARRWVEADGYTTFFPPAEG